MRVTGRNWNACSIFPLVLSLFVLVGSTWKGPDNRGEEEWKGPKEKEEARARETRLTEAEDTGARQRRRSPTCMWLEDEWAERRGLQYDGEGRVFCWNPQGRSRTLPGPWLQQRGLKLGNTVRWYAPFRAKVLLRGFWHVQENFILTLEHKCFIDCNKMLNFTIIFLDCYDLTRLDFVLYTIYIWLIV